MYYSNNLTEKQGQVIKKIVDYQKKTTAAIYKILRLSLCREPQNNIE
jgi:hypothetical protein